MTDQFLSKSNFAATKGWSRSYVTRLGHQGRLVMTADGKLVDVIATLAMIERTTDPSKTHVAQRHAARRLQRDVYAHVRSDSASEESHPDPAKCQPSYFEYRSRREAAMATMAEQEAKAMFDRLVSRETVVQAKDAIWRMVNDSILGLPAQLAPALATCTDSFKAELMMRDAFRVVLERLANATTGDLQPTETAEAAPV